MICVCDITGETKEAKPTKTGVERLPRNWRRFAGKTWSDAAWKEHYRCVALHIPIVEVRETVVCGVCAG